MRRSIPSYQDSCFYDRKHAGLQIREEPGLTARSSGEPGTAVHIWMCERVAEKGMQGI